MSAKPQVVLTAAAPKPLPQFSQALKYNGMVYCSGNIGMDPKAAKIVEGTVQDRTRQTFKNIQAVLEEAGSSLQNIVKVNVFITTMDNFAAMNEVYDEFITGETKPCRTCVAVKQLPFDTDVEIECIASITTTTTHDVEPARPPFAPSPTAANPPATTRPAPLDLPARDPDKSTFAFYFATGKAYLAFYKTGLKNIYLNTRLVWSLNAASGIPRDDDPSSPAAAAASSGGTFTTPTTTRAVGSTTRSTFILRRRWRYDVRRLPPFALLLLVCGEFTPFVVIAMPALVPYTCRIPRQIEGMQKKAEERRAASFKRLEENIRANRLGQEGGRQPDGETSSTANKTLVTSSKASLADAEAAAHIARSLNLISPLWDRLGLPDAALTLLSTRRKVQRHLDFLREDDALLVQAGGVDALEGEEVVLACVDRAIDTLGQSDKDLRERLRFWLQYVEEHTDEASQVQFLTERLLDKHA
ncbi:hypothetical protein N0V93_008726 [Gnomoniopsis smithogilvyi]|uniref:Letm1 RBD domain-containing protein n=1 Tax=Gnomoniopsis smithogilvyi TaxID=1191159 RepID=A0A9W8YNA0_9PEZI|nr:hypothetical protein N0V93_008726 [Gnomoniopsis smithogilvyi]